MSLVQFRPEAPFADLAHLVERNLAKVEVAGSIPVIRSKNMGTINVPIIIRRHGQAVRQRSATPLSPVRFRVAPPKKKSTAIAVLFFFGRATHESDRARRFKQNRTHFSSLFHKNLIRNRNVAESGPHSPLGDRQARLPGGERANIRRRRNSGIDSPPILCYNKIRKAVKICAEKVTRK